MEGRTISHYSILRKLGAGGMGEVYLAQDTTLDRKVAIKFLSQNSAVGEQANKRFAREAKAAAALDHPNICSVYEVGEEAGYSFIVMQYVEGETLASLIQHEPLELQKALDIAVQIADALAEAHSRRIIHRDVKPQNVMLTARGQVKVLDFGLARVVREDSPIENTLELWVRFLTCRPSRFEARSWTSAATSSVSERCSTRWRAGDIRFKLAAWQRRCRRS
jgi:serine/threonine-protein kinase